MKFLLMMCLIFLYPSYNSLGQDYKIKKSVVGSSSQFVQSSEYIAKGTVGQSIIGTSTNSSNKIFFGYWYDGSGFQITHSIYLLSGWNIISSFVAPENSDVEMIFDEIVDDIVIVKNNAGQVYIPIYDINDIGNWQIKEGYQVYTTQATVLNITGTKIKPEITPINMPFGWNIVAYLRSNAQDIEQSMKTLTDDNALVIAKNNAGNVFIPEYDINDIQNMIPGEGYQVYLSKASTLTYPENSQGKPTIVDYSYKPKKLIPEFTNTGNNSTLILDVGAEDGTEIGIYDSRDILIGSGVVRNDLAAVTIWGDDPNTDIKTGAANGEILTVKILNPKIGFLHELKLNELHSILNKEYSDVVTYYNDAVYFGKSSFSFLSDCFKVNPNPAIDFINLEYEVRQPGISSIKLYSVAGHELCTIIHEHREMGFYELTFNVENYPNGLYNIKYEQNGEKIIKTVVIVR